MGKFSKWDRFVFVCGRIDEFPFFFVLVILRIKMCVIRQAKEMSVKRDFAALGTARASIKSCQHSRVQKVHRKDETV